MRWAGCLSSHTFQDDQVNLKQGLVASQGIHSRDDGNEEVRLRVEVGDGSGTIIRHTAAGAITEELSIEETLDKTSVSRVAWAAALPELDYSDIAVRRSKPVVTSFLVSVLSKAVYMQEHHADGSPQAVGEAFDALQDGHPSLAESRTAALDHYSSALETLGITREVQPSLSTGFIASLLAGIWPSDRTWRTWPHTASRRAWRTWDLPSSCSCSSSRPSARSMAR